MSETPSVLKVYREQGLRAVIEGSWIYALQHSPLAPLAESVLGKPLREKLTAFPALGYWPRVRYPYSFNEKIIHRKLFTDEEIYSKVSDKWAVREYVKEKVGDGVLREVYHVTDDPDTIPFESLPNEFVIKATHGAGWVIIVENKSEEDFDSIRSECREWLSESFGTETNEYWYDRIEPQIIVEELMDGGDRKVPLDYKFYVFDGHVEFLQVDFGRFSQHTQRWYDKNWNPTSFERRYPLGPDLQKPDQLNHMIETAEELGADFDFVRVDLFNPDGQGILFGEITLAPGAGQSGFKPTKYDFELGSHWKN